MNFIIHYVLQVVKEDIPGLPPDIGARIRNAIERKLSFEPEKFGKPLRKSLKGYRKLRLGDYRVIFRIEASMIKIFMIGHRSLVYQDVV